jgi:hypothetical protein
MHMLTASLMMLLAAASCRSGAGIADETDAIATRGAVCELPGTEGARELEPVRPPEGCGWAGGGTVDRPVVVRSLEDVRARLGCQAGISGDAAVCVDFESTELHLVTVHASPAWARSRVFDDGATVTVGSIYRSPCEGDPMPFPMQIVLAIPVPRGETRALREASCSLPPDCD